ncbi:hypothetical protein [Methanobacterium aggregans]|uniref:hypothetical protein n=1 Tax=Methanobacterium aggregans TaxID=1615586 RepID=UPI001AE29C8E|nr:hypothetical protein [Methanobacterium aggregans]MBP2045826.1 hypothetical protein [Methanobacterium aggregans]
MDALELFAILVLAGAVVVLLYYYLQDARTGSLSRISSKVTGTNITSGFDETVSVVGEKFKGAGSKVTGTSETSEGGTMAGMSEKMAGMSEKIMGKVKEVPISTDVLSARIEVFLDEKSDQLIKDWDLATKSDVRDLEKRYSKVSRDVGELEGRFNEYRGYTNKKIKTIETRLEKLESEE